MGGWSAYLLHCLVRTRSTHSRDSLIINMEFKYSELTQTQEEKLGSEWNGVR
jgi:hypothetical protein